MAKKEIIEMLSWIDTPMDLYQITNEASLLYSIDEIEREFRTSRAYRGWIVWKRNKHEQTTCRILNIDTSDFKEVKIEQHHWPLTLYDIVMTIGMKMVSELKEEEYLTVYDIVSQVMKDHLDKDNIIGTVPLTITSHQLYHANQLDLKVEYINGDYNKFIERYKEFIPEAAKDRLKYNLSLMK